MTLPTALAGAVCMTRGWPDSAPCVALGEEGELRGESMGHRLMKCSACPSRSAHTWPASWGRLFQVRRCNAAKTRGEVFLDSVPFM